MAKTWDIYQRCSRLPLGNWLFSRLICSKAPYFGSIRPLIEELRPGYSRVTMQKRRCVTNHLGTVHAIAMCNMSELAAGLMLDVTIDDRLRWIPKGMAVSYRQLAKTDLTATCAVSVDRMAAPGDLPMTVDVADSAGSVVFQAVITMHLSARTGA